MPYFHHFLSESLVNNGSGGVKSFNNVNNSQAQQQHHHHQQQQQQLQQHYVSTPIPISNAVIVNHQVQQLPQQPPHQRPPMSTSIQPQQHSGNGMIKQIKSGYLLHHKKRLFGKAWKEEFVVLYEDSSVIWFRDRDRLDPEGGLFLRDAPEMLAAGQWVSRVPNKPEMPNGCDYKLSIAMGSRHREKVHWFLCKSESELIDWMSAISKTLPPPPPPPEELRDSRRNLALAAAAMEAAKMAPVEYKDMPAGTSSAAANQLSQRLDRMAITQAGLSDRTRSSSAGRLNHYAVNGTGSSSAAAAAGGQNPNPMLRQMSFPSKHVAGSSVEDKYSPPGKKYGEFGDVAAGIMIGGVLTQWNTGPDCWDWGMGWGWTGWNAAFCGTCAIEQAALANHVPSLATHQQTSFFNSSHDNDMSNSAAYFDDDNELGELGETTDVGCDFGDFGF